MNDLLRWKLTPANSRQKWLRITVEDGQRLRELLVWAESLPRLAGGRAGADHEG